MTKFVHNYVDGCAVCQSTKNLTHKTRPPIQPLETTNIPWRFISTDFVIDLPESKGYNSINVIVDQGLSKGIIITPCKKIITAEETTTLFQNHVLNQHSLPTKIVSDRGPQFVAKFTCELWKQLGITPVLSTAYHPQTDGEMEQVNQEIKQFLQIFCNYHQDNWVDLISFVEFSHNTWKHSATGRSLFKVLYRYNPPYSADSALETKVPAVAEHIQIIQEVQEDTTASLRIAAQHTKDWDLNQKLLQWEKGTLVWLEGTHIRTTHPKFKLAPRRYGPFKILAQVGSLAYKLEIPDH